MIKNRVIAITGGTGFIGSALAKQHVEFGDTVRVLSRSTEGTHNGISFFQVDLAQPSGAMLRGFLDGADIIYHCAGELYDKSRMEKLHVGGTIELLSAAKGSKARWVQLSSVGAYGHCRAGLIESASPERPDGVYECTKTASDVLVRNSGMDYVILRPSSVFGEAMTNQSLFKIVKAMKLGLFFYIGRGVIMNYVHIDDVVGALTGLGLRTNIVNKVYILSDQIPIEEMVRSLAEGLDINQPKLRFPKTPISLLVKILGKFPKFPLTAAGLNALTKRCVYNSSLIRDDIGFTFKRDLRDAFRQYASSIK